MKADIEKEKMRSRWYWAMGAQSRRFRSGSKMPRRKTARPFLNLPIKFAIDILGYEININALKKRVPVSRHNKCEPPHRIPNKANGAA